MQKEPSECPDCASVNIVFSQAREQTICRDCGLIFEPLALQDEQPKAVRAPKASKKKARK